jgi:hypothetical protein
VLRDSAGLTPSEKRRQHRAKGHPLGFYCPESRSSVASIHLFLDAIFGGCPAWLLRVRLIREALIAKVLYHEIGHHLQHTVAPKHRGREADADEWSKHLGRRHFRRRYWWVRPLLPFLRLMAAAIRKRRPRGDGAIQDIVR